MKVMVSFLMAVAPALLLVRYFYMQDRRHPEPKRMIVKIFLLGIIYIFPVYILEHMIGRLNVFGPTPMYHLFEAFIVAGLCEEYIKFRIVRKYVYPTEHFNEIIDGIIYTIVASLGFACIENVMYVMNGTWSIAIARGVTAVPMHAIASGLMGYYLGKAKFAADKKEEKRLMNKGLWTAIMVHGLYDFLIFISPMLGAAFR